MRCPDLGEPMRRREFIRAIAAGTLVWPLATRAQQSERTRRIGVLMGYPEGDKQAQAGVIALQKGLQSVGWIEDRNVQSDYRWAGPDADKARTFAKELVGMSPDVIVSSTNQVTAILQQETRTIPIVFAFVGDPVGSGFVQTLSKPGGNLTGFANFENSIGGKWLELLTELAPQAKRVGFIYCPSAAPNVGFFHAAQTAAPASGLALIPLPVNNAADIERGVTAFAAERNGGLIVAPHAVTLGNRDLIDQLALKYRLPAVYSDRYFVESGGLISFGNNTPDLFGRAASYVDRILKGAKPSELPVQLPTKFELVVNLKAPKAIGLSVPPTIISRADDVIE
jgi:putative tryptophan/tyrosine transport system substrate-binding protein